MRRLRRLRSFGQQATAGQNRATVRRRRQPQLARNSGATGCLQTSSSPRSRALVFWAAWSYPLRGGRRALRRLLDRLANTDIGAAAADVAGHCGVDIGVARIGIAREQCRGRHDLTRLAIAALDDFEIEPRLLNFLTCGRLSDRFDGRDRSVADALYRRYAGAYGRAVHMHGAGAAERHATAELGARHAEHIAQDPEERDVSVDVDVVLNVIDLDRERHGWDPFRAKAKTWLTGGRRMQQ